MFVHRVDQAVEIAHNMKSVATRKKVAVLVLTVGGAKETRFGHDGWSWKMNLPAGDTTASQVARSREIRGERVGPASARQNRAASPSISTTTTPPSVSLI